MSTTVEDVNEKRNRNAKAVGAVVGLFVGLTIMLTGAPAAIILVTVLAGSWIGGRTDRRRNVQPTPHPARGPDAASDTLRR